MHVGTFALAVPQRKRQVFQVIRRITYDVGGDLFGSRRSRVQVVLVNAIVIVTRQESYRGIAPVAHINGISVGCGNIADRVRIVNYDILLLCLAARSNFGIIELTDIDIEIGVKAGITAVIQRNILRESYTLLPAVVVQSKNISALAGSKRFVFYKFGLYVFELYSDKLPLFYRKRNGNCASHAVVSIRYRHAVSVARVGIFRQNTVQFVRVEIFSTHRHLVGSARKIQRQHQSGNVYVAALDNGYSVRIQSYGFQCGFYRNFDVYGKHATQITQPYSLRRQGISVKRIGIESDGFVNIL